MFDTINLTGEAQLTDQFIHETTPWRTKFFQSQPSSKDVILAGTWRCGLIRYDPGRPFGHPTIFKATHLATGITALYTPRKLIGVSASLPRVLFGENQQHFHWQHEVDLALKRVVEIMDTIAVFKDVAEYWKFSRVDITRPISVEFQTFRTSARFFRHSVSKKEPVIDVNSVHFRGENRSIFAYDKSVKEKLTPDGTTRLELRLRKKALLTQAYAGICLPNLGLSLSQAAICFRDTLREFPKFHRNPKNVPHLAHFLAELLCCKIQRNDVDYDVLGRYAACCCKNREAFRRMERRVIATVAQVTGFNIVDAIRWTHHGLSSARRHRYRQRKLRIARSAPDILQRLMAAPQTKETAVLGPLKGGPNDVSIRMDLVIRRAREPGTMLVHPDEDVGAADRRD